MGRLAHNKAPPVLAALASNWKPAKKTGGTMQPGGAGGAIGNLQKQAVQCDPVVGSPYLSYPAKGFG
jgi:hypothetical protein